MFLGLGGFQVFGFFSECFVEEGVLVFEAVEVLEDGRAVVVEAVVSPPLEEPDLDRDLGELVGVGVELDRGAAGR